MSSFTIDRRPLDQGVSLSLRGRVTADHATEIDGAFDELIEASPRIVVLDLAGVRFVGSFFVGALVRLGTELGRPGALRLAAIPDNVMETLRQSRLDDRFPIYATVDEASR
jgi:anti-anti-sigma factor